jgi:DNA-directed RNA polymerase specialized sigma24 family protein
MILCNIVQGVFQAPNSNLSISLITQNSLGQGFGYVVASYFPLYWYKTLEFEHLRFHGKYGFLFLLMPVIVVYGIFYPISQDLMAARKYVYIVPFFYGSYLIWEVCKSIVTQYRRDGNRTNLQERFLIVMNIIPWMSVPFIGIGLGQPQWVLDIVLNSCFLVSNGLFIRHIVKKSREEQNEHDQLQIDLCDKEKSIACLKKEQEKQRKAFTKALNALKQNNTDPMLVFEFNCQLYKLSPAEIRVVKQVRLGFQNKEIANQFGRSIRTIETHMSNIYSKVGIEKDKEKDDSSVRAKLMKELNIMPENINQFK